MNRFRSSRSEERGIALLSALALLFLFSLLGVAYVGYMATLADQARYEARVVQTRAMARGGVLTAIREIETRIAQRNLNELPTAYETVLPVYRKDAAAPNGVAAAENRRATTAIAISDESGKVNLNYAPAPVLARILRTNPGVAGKIRGSVQAAGRRFISLDELVSRGFIAPSAASAINENLLTVYSVADPADPSASLNLNAAPVPVLAAALALTPKAARAAAAQRPFASAAALTAAVGKGPETFNYRAPAGRPGALAPELCFESRCFRIESRASIANLGRDGEEHRATQSRIEAVVVFGHGEPRITFWSERRGADGTGGSQTVKEEQDPIVE
ncbi:MAG: hypothetical protein GWP08_00940 [Nitrospiraceae bacterium]|nr:hypothetical protein [Nitrospiraceae bacterium]